uniref:Uncharacterized protein n=1 Tax=Vespula pensylvanica TaxID=30213 RepID=A0A834UH39_VESPE|nr:hypothetical protein H0235_001807 [Vespula pensylvanica]
MPTETMTVTVTATATATVKAKATATATATSRRIKSKHHCRQIEFGQRARKSVLGRFIVMKKIRRKNPREPSRKSGPVDSDTLVLHPLPLALRHNSPTCVSCDRGGFTADSVRAL